MNSEERINRSETRQFRMVFHNTTNDHDTLFGGIAMQWMDEVAYITATRYTRMKMVTVSAGKIEFLKPITCGSIVEIIGKVVKTGSVRVEVVVQIFSECVNCDERNIAIEANFIFVAVDDNNNPIPLRMKMAQASEV